MPDYNSLLQRQIKKCGISPDEYGGEKLQKLLGFVSATYYEFEEERKLLERSFEISSKEYQEYIQKLQALQAQIIHTEKMAGIGQLSAGIAHEINNPLGYVLNNMEILKRYIGKIQEMFQINREMMNSSEMNTLEDYRQKCALFKSHVTSNKIDYIFHEIRI